MRETPVLSIAIVVFSYMALASAMIWRGKPHLAVKWGMVVMFVASALWVALILGK